MELSPYDKAVKLNELIDSGQTDRAAVIKKAIRSFYHKNKKLTLDEDRTLIYRARVSFPKDQHCRDFQCMGYPKQYEDGVTLEDAYNLARERVSKPLEGKYSCLIECFIVESLINLKALGIRATAREVLKVLSVIIYNNVKGIWAESMLHKKLKELETKYPVSYRVGSKTEDYRDVDGVLEGVGGTHLISIKCFTAFSKDRVLSLRSNQRKISPTVYLGFNELGEKTRFLDASGNEIAYSDFLEGVL